MCGKKSRQKNEFRFAGGGGGGGKAGLISLQSIQGMLEVVGS